MTDEQINQLFDLKQKLDAGIITKEIFDKEVSVLKGENQPEIINNSTTVNPKYDSMQTGYTKWIVIGAILLFAIIIVLTIVNSNNSAVETTDDYCVEVPDVQQTEFDEPVYQEPEWTPSCGEWEMDQNSALLRLRYNKQPVFIRYYPGDRFEMSAPDLGMNDWCFKIKDSDGNKVNIVTSTQHHVQGSERVEIDDPASIKILYRLLERGNFTIQPAWLIDVKVGSEGCGLAEFVWHKFTEQDPYTNDILGKSTNGDYSPKGSRVYDNDPKNGLGSDEALELIIRSELGDEDATNQLNDAINQELQRVVTQ